MRVVLRFSGTMHNCLFIGVLVLILFDNVVVINCCW